MYGEHMTRIHQIKFGLVLLISAVMISLITGFLADRFMRTIGRQYDWFIGAGIVMGVLIVEYNKD